MPFVPSVAAALGVGTGRVWQPEVDDTFSRLFATGRLQALGPGRAKVKPCISPKPKTQKPKP